MKTIFAIIMAVMCAGATTQPTTVPSIESDLRRIIRGLQKQILDLKTENQALKKDIAAKNEEIKQLNEMLPPPVVAGEHIKIGMTLAEVNRIAGVAGELKTDTGGDRAYQWTISNTRPIVDDQKSYDGGTYTLTGIFQDGKLVRYSQHLDLNGEGGGVRVR